MGQEAPHPDLVKRSTDLLVQSLKQMERWLTNHKKLSGDERTIADLQAAQEIEQLKLIPAYDTVIAKEFPRLNAWAVEELKGFSEDQECYAIRHVVEQMKAGKDLGETILDLEEKKSGHWPNED